MPITCASPGRNSAEQAGQHLLRPASPQLRRNRWVTLASAAREHRRRWLRDGLTVKGHPDAIARVVRSWDRLPKILLGWPNRMLPDGPRRGVEAIVVVAPGDSSTEFRAWVTPSLSVMARVAGRLAPSADRDDVLQEALTTAWRRRSTFDATRGTRLRMAVRDRREHRKACFALTTRGTHGIYRHHSSSRRGWRSCRGCRRRARPTQYPSA